MTDYPYGRASQEFTGWVEKKVFAPLNAAAFGAWLPFETRLTSWQWAACGSANHSLVIRGTELTVVRDGFNGAGTTLSGSDVFNLWNQRTFSDFPGLFTFEVTVGVRGMREYMFRMDANESLDVYGCNVRVDLLGPAGAFVDPYPGGTATGVINEQLAADGLVSPAVMVVENGGGSGNTTRYSERFTIPTMTQSVFTVPRYAKQLDIYVEPAPPPVASWQALLGNPTLADARPIQQLTFSGQESLGNQIGSASHIRTDSAAGARDVELIWTIAP